MKKSTRVNHQPGVKFPPGNKSLISPIYQSVKFTYPTIAESIGAGGFDYTRDANPTTRQLELLAAELQDRDDAVAVATGMAAIWLTLLGNLKTGDRILIFLESYRPTRVAVRKFLPRLGIEYSMVSIHDHDAIKKELAKEDTKLMLFESPTNPMLQVGDIQALVDLAKSNNVVVALDNTFAGLHNHGQFEVDYYIHSLTKYANGHGDAMGGIVIGSKEKIRRIKPFATNMGPTLDPYAAFLILRGLKTYYLRYRQHSINASRIAEYLHAHAKVERVNYPGLETDPGYALAAKQMHDTGGVLAFELAANKDQAWQFIDSLQIFATTASLGSTESLVAPVRLYLGSDLSDDELRKSGITDATVRLAVGVEDVDDLIGDLQQAFAAVF